MRPADGNGTSAPPGATTAGYPQATVTPAEAGLQRGDVPPQAPLPVTAEPLALPFVGEHPAGADEPLIPLQHLPGIVDLATYHRAGWPGSIPVSHARRDAVARLAAATYLLPEGFGFAVFDAWRPLPLQRAIYQHFYHPGSALEHGFVSVPSDSPATPPPHLTGGTFDLTLTWQGQPLALGTAFDEFSDRAHTRALEREESVDRDLRRLLVHTLGRVAFVSLPHEWWHFEYGTRRWAGWWMAQPLYSVATLEG